MEQYLVIVHEVDHDNSRYDAYILGEGVYQSEGDYLADINDHFQSVLEEDTTLIAQSSYKVTALTSEGPKHVDEFFMSEMGSPEAKADDPQATDFDYGVGDLD